MECSSCTNSGVTQSSKASSCPMSSKESLISSNRWPLLLNTLSTYYFHYSSWSVYLFTSSRVTHFKDYLLRRTYPELLIFSNKYAPPPFFSISSTYSVAQARKLDVILSLKSHPLFQSHFQIVNSFSEIDVHSARFFTSIKYHWRPTPNHLSPKPQ